MQNPFEENTAPVRTTFLTILCILTFIWNAVQLYTGIRRVFMPEAIMAEKEQSNEMMMDIMSKYMSASDLEKFEESRGQMDAMFEKKQLITGGVANLVSGMLLILGGIWMWGLRKKGFYVYLAGNAVGVLAPIILLGGSMGWSIGIFSLINAALFSGLYALHLKSFS